MTAICFSCAEVTSIGRHGFWLECASEELYLSFFEFPLFEYATVAQICQVECPSSGRVYWPALDLDIGLEAIRYPIAHAQGARDFDC